MNPAVLMLENDAGLVYIARQDQEEGPWAVFPISDPAEIWCDGQYLSQYGEVIAELGENGWEIISQPGTTGKKILGI